MVPTDHLRAAVQDNTIGPDKGRGGGAHGTSCESPVKVWRSSSSKVAARSDKGVRRGGKA
jgi:hypothetical protein